MRARMRGTTTYANVASTLALVLALCGTAIAAGSYVVSSNSEIAPGTVSGAAGPSGDNQNIISGSIGRSDLADGSVDSVKLQQSSVYSGNIADGHIFNRDLADGSVSFGKLEHSDFTRDFSFDSLVNDSRSYGLTSVYTNQVLDWYITFSCGQNDLQIEVFNGSSTAAARLYFDSSSTSGGTAPTTLSVPPLTKAVIRTPSTTPLAGPVTEMWQLEVHSGAANKSGFVHWGDRVTPVSGAPARCDAAGGITRE